MSPYSEGTIGYALREALLRLEASMVNRAQAMAVAADGTGAGVLALAAELETLGAAHRALVALEENLAGSSLRAWGR